MTSMPGKSLFLDRDGTLNVDTGYLSHADAVELLPGVKEAVGRALELGYRLFLFTNQSGIGRGYFTMEDAEAVNDRLVALLGYGSDIFTEVCIAPEHPDDPPVYRKPTPRFILESLERYELDPKESYMVGDRMSDWDAGLNAGIQSVALETGEPITEGVRAYIKEKGIQLFPDFPAFVATLS